MMSFCPKDFVQMTSDKPFKYHSGLWLFLSHISWSQTCYRLQNGSIEDSEVDSGNPFEKIDCADLVKNATSVTGFSEAKTW